MNTIISTGTVIMSESLFNSMKAWSAVGHVTIILLSVIGIVSIIGVFISAIENNRDKPK